MFIIQMKNISRKFLCTAVILDSNLCEINDGYNFHNFTRGRLKKSRLGNPVSRF